MSCQAQWGRRVTQCAWVGVLPNLAPQFLPWLAWQSLLAAVDQAHFSLQQQQESSAYSCFTAAKAPDKLAAGTLYIVQHAAHSSS